jgi:recombination DNA repair RAD52 pathway protein
VVESDTDILRPGDQYGNVPNPFVEPIPRISEYTAQQIATLQRRLDKFLGPEYLASRQGFRGEKLYYVPGEKAINLANEVFGFNGWSSSIQNVQIDYVGIQSTINLDLANTTRG